MTNLMSQLSKKDQQTVLECMNAASRGPFFPDWEFDTLFGISKNVVISIITNWPNIVIQDKNVAAAIIGSMNNLLGYPHGLDDRWSEYISVSPEIVKETLEKLRILGL